MPYFFKSTAPDGTEAVYGPFDKEDEATTCRDAVITDRPEHTVEELFVEDPRYLETLPRPFARVPLSDGTTQEMWTDGSEKIIPAE